MEISGLQKITLVDYSGVIAATVFTRGCSFRCPFCHNPELVLPGEFNPVLSNEEILDFFRSRRGKLQGVCITGGEPLLHKDIDKFIHQLKEMGYKVKLDTNGSFPKKLEPLIKSGDLDYIAMDIKTTLDKYQSVVNPKLQITNSKQIKNHNSELSNSILKSINMIMKSGIPYEFRTTVCHPLHIPDDFHGIGELIRGAERYFIQNFVHSKHVDSQLEFNSFSDQELNESLSIIKKYVEEAEIR